jgi:hypothetical protein
VLEHLIQVVAILGNVSVINRETLLGKGLTGRRRVGSGILSENPHFFQHRSLVANPLAPAYFEICPKFIRAVSIVQGA